MRIAVDLDNVPDFTIENVNRGAGEGIVRASWMIDGVDHYRCTRCRCVKPVTDFWMRSGRTGSKKRPMSHCKACRSTPEMRAKYKANYYKHHATRYSYRARAKRYGATEDHIRSLLEPGTCGICGEHRAASASNTKFTLHIDHDHDTGRIRGVLCSSCNNGLGRFRDRIDLLLRAADYLKGYG